MRFLSHEIFWVYSILQIFRHCHLSTWNIIEQSLVNVLGIVKRNIIYFIYFYEITPSFSSFIFSKKIVKFNNTGKILYTTKLNTLKVVSFVQIKLLTKNVTNNRQQLFQLKFNYFSKKIIFSKANIVYLTAVAKCSKNKY